jgi:microcystin-dependent protein/cytoskeletal protein CcmA (bactofilin family)
MAYTIPYTDEANNGRIIVVDNTLNQETSLKIPGRNYTGYGTAISENFLHLLEHFANTLPPDRPIEGQLWYDTTTDAEQLKIYDGTNWVPAGGLNKSANEPDVNAAGTGDLWVDTDNQQLYLNSGGGWVLVGPNFSDGLATGASPLTVAGTDNKEYTIVIVEVQAQPVAIIATNEFTPKSVIPGFTTIKPGVNLSNRDITGSGAPKFVGTSEKAESLIVNNESVPAGNFLRGDTTSTSTFPLNVQNNTGLILGTDAALNLAVEGQAGIIQHQIEGSNIDVRVRSGGTSRTVLRVDSSQRLGVNNEAPDEALDVIGNIKTDSNLQVDGTANSSTINTGAIVTKGGVGVAKNLNVGGNATFNNLSTFANVVPDGNNNRNLGSPTSKWQNAYATTFIGNLTGNVSGTVSGVAGSANSLTTETTFRISGDVNSQDIKFNGQQPDGLAVFNAELSNAVIGQKEEVLTSNLDDEILINRVTGDTGLYKINRRNLLNAVPTNPPGIVLPYAGTEIPAGWLLCDGSQYRISEFSELFSVIGYAFGARPTLPTGFFKVPDMRGRLPLGADNMGDEDADVVTAGYAEAVGQIGGAENKTIGVDNLPEHEHDLRGDSGDQYYAIRDVAGTPRDEEAIQYDAPTGLGNGQALPNSGGVISSTDLGQPLNVMNPSMTLNYIIYTGRVAS